jgi:stage IV sporulation protein A
MHLAYELEEKYGVPVALVSCLELDAEDIRHILELVLHEFPVAEIALHLPEWTRALDAEHPIRRSLLQSIRRCADRVSKIGDVKDAFADLGDNEYIKAAEINQIDLGTGKVRISMEPIDGLYYQVISELTGFEIEGEQELIALLRRLAVVQEEYNKIEGALRDAEEKGYGIVMPDIEDMTLEEPRIVKQAGGYGVKLRAGAQSIHMIRAEIATEINPVIGTREQADEMVAHLVEEYEQDPDRIWDFNLFGKSLYEMLEEGIYTKLENMPEESRAKLSETLERIINEGSGGLVCILL